MGKQNVSSPTRKNNQRTIHGENCWSHAFFVCLGIGTFVATYIYMGIFISSGERTTYRIRKAYLKGIENFFIFLIFAVAVLKQNISWFDSEGAGEIATRISSDTLNIQDGISDKVPLFLSQV